MTDLEILRKIEERIGKKLKKISEDEIKEEFNSYLILDYYSINKNNEITGISIYKIYYKKFYDLIINLKKLKYLYLLDNQIIDISALKDLTNLNNLNLFNNQIRDISALKDLTNLNNLNLSNNQIIDISALKDLTNLNNLSLSYNQIRDISALKDLTNLNNLGLSYNHEISDILALKDLTNLNTLDLSVNSVNNISVLKNLTNLDRLFLFNNLINDISALKELKKLTTLDLRYNSIKILPEWITDFDKMKIQWQNRFDYNYISFYDNPLESPLLNFTYTDPGEFIFSDPPCEQKILQNRFFCQNIFLVFFYKVFHSITLTLNNNFNCMM